jgi:ribosomal protein L37AE/L43A
MAQKIHTEVSMIDETFEPQCKLCGDVYDSVRYDIGYHICMSCGDEVAKLVKRTVVPMHKSNLVMITNRDDLIGINNKGGLVR